MAIKKHVHEMVEESKTRVENLSVEQLKQEMAVGNVLVVDIRDVRERQKLGFIPGSVHVPRGMLEFWADPESKYYRDFMKPEQRTALY